MVASRHLSGVFVILSFITLLSGCTTVPITGRSQMRFMSNADVGAQTDLAVRALIDRAKASGALVTPHDPQSIAALERVARVSAAISKAAAEVSSENVGNTPAVSWETHVIRRSTTNALVTPSGKIIIYTGLLEVAQTESMLAAAIGHEMAHVVAQHAAERMSQNILADITVRLAVVAVAASQPRYAPIVATTAPLVAQGLFLLPYSRQHESEADRIGMVLMAKAGYDPNDAVAFWDRMAARGGSEFQEFLSTHPTATTRRNDLKKWLAEASAKFNPERAAANEALRVATNVPRLGNSDAWWREFNAIVDARVAGAITPDEADRLKQDLMNRTVDASYPSLKGVSIDENPEFWEFWEKILKIQARRNAGTMTVWDADKEIRQLLVERGRAQ